MSRLFGTDGVRGVANDELTPELAYCIGRAGAVVISETCERRPACFLVGRDTRASGEMLECALVAGILSTGCSVRRVGVMTTPAISSLISPMNCEGGFVISASHNPFQYNGIKVFSPDGCKLPDPLEDEIERTMKRMSLKDDLPRARDFKVGRLIEDAVAADLYVKRVREMFRGVDLSGMKLVLDCANGAAGRLAPRVLRELGAYVEVINCDPDGFNINAGCGSTSPLALSSAVVQSGADAGIAYDGDGDRAIGVDERGRIVDGDQIMAIFADYMLDRDLLNGNAVAATVLSNLGLELWLRERGVTLERTLVGDKYVFQRMVEKGLNLGGEQSGHIILRDYANTGDGIITSVQLARIMIESRRRLSELASVIQKVPQVAVNVPVPNDLRHKLLKHEEMDELKAMAAGRLGSNGRVVVRGSGTEPVIRVLVEANPRELAEEVADGLVSGISELADRLSAHSIR